MTGVRNRGEAIRAFILTHVEKHERDLAQLTAERFAITRQAVHGHLQRLMREGLLAGTGARANHRYTLSAQLQWGHRYKLGDRLDSDLIWRRDLKPRLGERRQTIFDIWQYGAAAMLDNACRHSGASSLRLRLRRTAVYAEMTILDDGVGIFRKIEADLQLAGAQQARLELARRLMTSVPVAGPRPGIVLVAQLFDSLAIVSRGVCLCAGADELSAWATQGGGEVNGTLVWMKLYHNSNRSLTSLSKQLI